MTIPPHLAFVPFAFVDHMMKLVRHVGIETMLKGICDYAKQDFRRWALFDKTPRVASHSKEGVIELMPTSDGEVYGAKYVNGHPKNTKEGLQTASRHPEPVRRFRRIHAPGPDRRRNPTSRRQLSGDQNLGDPVRHQTGAHIRTPDHLV